MNKPITLYGKMLAFSRLVLNCTLDELDDALKNALEYSEKIVPVVLECEQELPLDELLDKLWAHQVAVMGVIDGVMNEQATKHKLAIFPADGKRIDRLQIKSAETGEKLAQNYKQTLPDKTSEISSTSMGESSAELPLSVQEPMVTATPQNTQYVLQTKNETFPERLTKIYRQMVRSGQSIHHIGGDLIITASINNGAEVATDYNLHIYGKGQGRLVAGATGDENTHIFCQNFAPTLVSVAGTYCLKDDIPKEVIGKAVQVSFSKEKGLIFTVIG